MIDTELCLLSAFSLIGEVISWSSWIVIDRGIVKAREVTPNPKAFSGSAGSESLRSCWRGDAIVGGGGVVPVEVGNKLSRGCCDGERRVIRVGLW